MGLFERESREPRGFVSEKLLRWDGEPANFVRV